MMAKVCKIEVNGDTFSAYRGDLLLDAALLHGIHIPHDCRAGRCGTCRVRVLDGRVFGGQTDDPEAVYACQCRIVSDLSLAVDDVPEVFTTRGVVADVVPRAPDVCEVCIETTAPVEYIPGQYFSVRFRGFPARCFSPTAPIEWPCDENVMRFHIRRVRDGRVSSAVGHRIRAGHRVKLEGPFGSACLRPQPAQRLVLVASGTGFAPMWSIAEAAIGRAPRLRLVLVVAARTLESLYMVPALCRLARFPNVTIIPVVSERQTVTPAVRMGRPTDYLPPLTAADIVYAAGAPAMVKAVAEIARAAGAKCYSDPFEAGSSGAGASGLWSRAIEWLSQERRSPLPSRFRPETSAPRPVRNNPHAMRPDMPNAIRVRPPAGPRHGSASSS
jgi:3-phenylpropionate/trans-cinnamate dioxygenase ferredoxin reductase subunit